MPEVPFQTPKLRFQMPELTLQMPELPFQMAELGFQTPELCWFSNARIPFSNILRLYPRRRESLTIYWCQSKGGFFPRLF